MKVPSCLSLILFSILWMAGPAWVIAQAEVMELPTPHKTGGASLMDALAKRATSRAFDPGAPELTQQQLSNLLWAAFGISRPDGKRTAPSALNFQEIDVYVLLRQGTFVYDAAKNQLRPVEGENGARDLRTLGGSQAFVKNATLTLVYVANFSRMGRMGEDLPAAEAKALRRETAAFSAGAISQNASLYCASEGLITGVRLSVDREKLGAALGLGNDQWISLVQSVGRPKP